MPGRLVARLAGAALGLPPTRPGPVRVTRDLPVRVRDGVVLRTDHYSPSVPDAPTVLIRTPYGRGGPLRLLGRLLAAGGCHAVIQSCRGTGGSGGTFAPLVHERDDGVDTLDWLRRQPWWTGRLGMFGVSYQGFAQWALAADAGEELRAMVAVVTASATRDSTYAGESFALDTVLTWAELLHAQTVPWLARQWELKRGQPRLAAALAHLPLAEADRVATGVRIPFFQEWLRHHTPQAAYWRTRVFADRVGRVRAPVVMVTGWHDIFLPAQLDDHAVLRAAGTPTRLVVGPWTHGSPGLFVAALREGLSWLDAHLPASAPARGRLRRGSAAVRVHVGGAGGGWRDLPHWPPPAVETAWHLHPDGELAVRPPVESAPDGFRYDPADPTPSVGGPLLVAQRAGPVDNRHVEARPDVLTYTSAALTRPVEVVGPVRAEIHVRSELPYLDVFVRLCDVDRRGRSWNVCDGLVRVTPEDVPADAAGVRRVVVSLWPTAYRFGAGHRLRAQVSGGAHPRWARNPGTGDSLGEAVTLRAGWRQVLHDPAYPSAVVLPIVHSAPAQSPI
ncbi:CocE/NonD family hydrolase [Micromonospora sp. WMMD1120]|uniref:CocE/NonD family hydrolase n=1 Tax=Micromonospora sp. WMMD1120 TaxID=3016106 RepID=UPI002415B683|nr:CocE/NonD family hydrolase [Micromonospora sp. WMMD1120]MDG4805191.1 CocE/NonD family hydrolase [Micromonospora sp. WMMD1120]